MMFVVSLGVYKKSDCEMILIFCSATENLPYSIHDAQVTSLSAILIERRNIKFLVCSH